MSLTKNSISTPGRDRTTSSSGMAPSPSAALPARMSTRENQLGGLVGDDVHLVTIETVGRALAAMAHLGIGDTDNPIRGHPFPDTGPPPSGSGSVSASMTWANKPYRLGHGRVLHPRPGRA